HEALFVALESQKPSSVSDEPATGRRSTCLSRLRLQPAPPGLTHSPPRPLMRNSAPYATVLLQRAGRPRNSLTIDRKVCSQRRFASSPTTGHQSTTGATARRS